MPHKGDAAVAVDELTAGGTTARCRELHHAARGPTGGGLDRRSRIRRGPAPRWRLRSGGPPMCGRRRRRGGAGRGAGLWRGRGRRGGRRQPVPDHAGGPPPWPVRTGGWAPPPTSPRPSSSCRPPPVGMDGTAGGAATAFDPDLVHGGQMVADLVYHPMVTPLLAAAHERRRADRGRTGHARAPGRGGHLGTGQVCRRRSRPCGKRRRNVQLRPVG